MIFSKVDFRPIVTAHFDTLRNNQFIRSTSLGDLAVFFGVPAAVAVAVAWLGFRFSVDAVNGFLNVFSVLTGLLLNLLVLVITLATSKTAASSSQSKRLRFIKEIFANVCFCVLISVFVLCTALVALSYMHSRLGATTGIIATLLLTSLTSNFVLTLLMILKRMYILLNKELNGDATGHNKIAS